MRVSTIAAAVLALCIQCSAAMMDMAMAPGMAMMDMAPSMGMGPMMAMAPGPSSSKKPAVLTTIPSGCKMVSSSSVAATGRRLQASDMSNSSHNITLSSQTVHWGYYYGAVEPAAVIMSGDTVTVEMATHHAGDDYDKMVNGDAGMEDVYTWTQSKMNVPFRGRTGHGDGVHILTGPIYVCGADAGDVLQVEIVDLVPRVNPSTGKTYGSNAAASWGYQFRAGFLDGVKREVITIYEIIKDASNKLLYAVPDYQFKYNAPAQGYVGPVTPCVPTSGTVPNATTNYEWTNYERSFRKGNIVPCENGTQTWKGYWYPGLITTHPTKTEDYSIRGKFKVPVNLHIGNMGVASAYPQTVDSVPPAIHGGNVDDRRIGKGATMYYPVQVPGALLSLGDAHTSQGDSEFDGTAIETSLTATLKITLHKKGSLPKFVSKLNFPLLENANEYVVHGFTYNDYLKELDMPFKDIYSKSSLDRAFTVAYNNTRDFIMNAFDLTEDQAITAITVGMDFGVDQVVDGNWGIHCIVPKWMFNMSDMTPYMPVVMPGTSKPANMTLQTTL
ncbi:probable formamidase C869.04 [Coccomyxa sp. Obi]|nr:probable formamidase C869.04 [Coccomyxa sp. Obi]